MLEVRFFNEINYRNLSHSHFELKLKLKFLCQKLCKSKIFQNYFERNKKNLTKLGKQVMENM
jgi:hypothetical protein